MSLLLERLRRRLSPSGRLRPDRVKQVQEVVSTEDPIWVQQPGDDYKEFWTRVAGTWRGACTVTRGTTMDRDEMHAKCEYLARNMITSLRLGKDSDVLEVGCGMGAMAFVIAPEVKSYHGADISAAMLEHAREGLAQFSNVTLHELSRCDLSIFPDEKFDAAIFEAVLIHMDREDAFRYMEETHRVLKPGGRAYFMFHSLLEPQGFQMFRRMQTDFCDGRGQNLSTRARVHSPDEVRCYCRHAGFTIDEGASQMNLPREANKIHYENHILVAICEKV